jgi:hypothetical protein
VARLHGGNYTSTERHFQDLSIILPKAISQNPELAALLQEKLAEWHCLVGIDYLEQGNKSAAKKHLWESISRNPLRPKPMIARILVSCGPAGRGGLRGWRRVRAFASPIIQNGKGYSSPAGAEPLN